MIIDNLSSGKTENLDPRARFYKLDIGDDRVEKVIAEEKPRFLYHFAAQINVSTSQQDPVFDANTNIMGTIKLLNNAVKYGIEKIIFASSAAIYGEPLYLAIDEKHPVNPLSFYGLSKYSAECYIRMFAATFGLRYSILRFANVYGTRQEASNESGVIAQFIDKYLREEKLSIHGNGEQTRDFIYVGDLVAACSKALYLGDNRTLNISTGKAVSINQLCKILDSIKGCETYPVYGSWREGGILHSVLDNRKARSLLLWNPRTSLREGLEKTFRFAQEREIEDAD